MRFFIQLKFCLILLIYISSRSIFSIDFRDKVGLFSKEDQKDGADKALRRLEAIKGNINNFTKKTRKRFSFAPIVYRCLENSTIIINPYGYVKHDTYFDTRQVVGPLDNYALLFPARIRLDVIGRDINAHGQFRMNNIQTLAGINILGPLNRKIKTFGSVEGEFRGTIGNIFGEYTLRVACGILKWKNNLFLFGQFYHPLFIAECYPHTLNYNSGAPYTALSRNAQLRYSYKYNNCRFNFTAATQSLVPSFGPIGFSFKYIKNAIVPNLNFEFKKYWRDNIIGFSLDYKRLVPRLVSDKNFKVKEHINSFVATCFAAFSNPPFSLRMQAFYAQNANDYALMSGYAVKTVDPVTDKRTYSNTAVVSAWLDASYIFWCNKMELGIFMASLKNLGSRDRLYINPKTGQPIVYSLIIIAKDVDNAYKIAPRFVVSLDPVRIGFEVIYDAASYGCLNNKAQVINACRVHNVRILGSLFYVF